MAWQGVRAAGRAPRAGGICARGQPAHGMQDMYTHACAYASRVRALPLCTLCTLQPPWSSPTVPASSLRSAPPRDECVHAPRALVRSLQHPPEAKIEPRLAADEHTKEMKTIVASEHNDRAIRVNQSVDTSYLQQY